MWGLKTALCGAEVYLIETNPWVVEWGRGSEEEGEGVILSDHAIQDLSGPHRERRRDQICGCFLPLVLSNITTWHSENI